MSITWNGVSSDTIGVIVERIPNRHVPTRRFSPQQVAGRNGNILLVDKAFPNVEQEYEVYLSAESQGLPSVARACAEWLMGPDGYCRLEDSYDTTVYREAFLMGGFDIENILNKFGRCTITFSCKPQKYLLTGDTPIEIPAGITTYTGDVVQFDGVTGASITSLSTTITPTQDLHGYSHPWPAGGGKNKAHDVVYANPTSRYSPVITASYNLEAGARYIFSFMTENTGEGVYRQTPSSIGLTSASAYDFTCDGTRKSFYGTAASDATITNKGIILKSENDGIPVGLCSQFMVEKVEDTVTTPSAYAPYSNICPISGRTGLSVYVGPTQDQQDATTYAFDWTSEAGTVYGGTLDVTTGVLTIDKAYKAFDGTENWGIVNGAYFMTVVGPLNSVVNDSAISTHYPSASGISVNNYKTGFTCYNRPASPYTGAVVLVRPEAPLTTSLADFKAWLATQNTNGTPFAVCYELATPLTYQLTGQEIEVLVGENNVWTSSGPVSVTVEAPFVGTVTNPTPFEARPMLEVSGVGEITINGKTIQILEAVSDFNIDCESMEAEDNSKIYCIDFPELSGGENEIAGDGSITALTVTPRWWTL